VPNGSSSSHAAQSSFTDSTSVRYSSEPYSGATVGYPPNRRKRAIWLADQLFTVKSAGAVHELAARISAAIASAWSSSALAGLAAAGRMK
jgi:hypothetical protein